MSVKIKFQRRGRTKKPIYRIVVQDSKTARDSKVIEVLGQYNPLTEPTFFEISEEKVQKWISNGAQPTESVERLLISKGVIKAKNNTKQVVKKEEPVVVEAEQKAEETTKEEPVAKKKSVKKTEE